MFHYKPLLVIVSLLIAGCGDGGTSTETDASTELKPYPLTTCLVSGEELGSMGDPVVIVHDGQEIKFCCKHCVPKFEQDPAKYLAKLQGRSNGDAPDDPSGHSH